MGFFTNCEMASKEEIANRIDKDVIVVTIDSCEYIANYTHNGCYVFTHKGNCKYCQKRLEETIRKIIKE